MRVSIVFILPILVFGAGGILLQIFLSKKESKWAGLILPFISFGIALTALLGFVFLSTVTTTTMGVVVEQTTTQMANASSIIVSAIYLFLLYNIPTAILLAIYAACRGSRNRRRDLDKMNAQDLG